MDEDDKLEMFDASNIQPLVEKSACVDEFDLFDAISSIEQEFCYESEIFVFSRISCWSKMYCISDKYNVIGQKKKL